MRRLYFSFILFSFVIGCNTVNSRIKEKQALFNTYPPEVQAQIQSGHLDKGMTEEMVYLAKGNPSQKHTHYKGKKKITVWKYTKAGVMESKSTNADTGFSGAYGYPEPGKIAKSHPMSYSKPYLKVEFENGKLKNYQYLETAR